jgi:hypothetical protein
VVAFYPFVVSLLAVRGGLLSVRGEPVEPQSNYLTIGPAHTLFMKIAAIRFYSSRACLSLPNLHGSMPLFSFDSIPLFVVRKQEPLTVLETPARMIRQLEGV